MSRFFNIFAGTCALLLLGVILSGYFRVALGITFAQHMLFGLTTAILCVSLHCLIFAIFTGSGKDTRLLSEDLKLDASFLKRAKGFKRTIFPPALYAIFFLILTTSFGGLAAAKGTTGWVWAHIVASWFTAIYNWRTFYKEAVGVKENSTLIDAVNVAAALKAPSLVTPLSEAGEVIPGAIENLSWGAHVFALGKFLMFMAYNTWLPFLYFKYIMGLFTTPFWPFLLLSAVLFGGGYYLRYQYRSFRPGARPST